MNKITYRLAKLYITTSFRSEFIDKALKLKKNESSKEQLELIWDAMDAVMNIHICHI